MKHKPNSKLAYEQIQSHIGPQQWRVYQYITLHGPCIRKQICQALGLGEGSVNPRVIELRDELKLIKEGESIKQANGRPAALLEALPVEGIQGELF